MTETLPMHPGPHVTRVELPRKVSRAPRNGLQAALFLQATLTHIGQTGSFRSKSDLVPSETILILHSKESFVSSTYTNWHVS